MTGRDDEPDGLDYMGTTWVERNEYDNLRGHRDRLRKERDAGRDQLAGAVAALEKIAALPRTRPLREGASAIVSSGEAAEIASSALAALRGQSS